MEHDQALLRREALRGESRQYVDAILGYPESFQDAHIDLFRPVSFDPTREDDHSYVDSDMPPMPQFSSAAEYTIFISALLDQLGIAETDLQAAQVREYDATIRIGDRDIPYHTVVYRVHVDDSEAFLHQSTYPPGHLDPAHPDIVTALAIGPEHDI